MTQTQKFLKGIENMVGFPQPKGKVARRLKQRGNEYRSRMDSLSAAHERKRLLLLRLRREKERQAEEVAPLSGGGRGLKPFAQAAIERKRHYGEPMRWAIK